MKYTYLSCSVLYRVSNSIAILDLRPPYPIDAPASPRASIPEGSLSFDWKMISVVHRSKEVRKGCWPELLERCIVRNAHQNLEQQQNPLLHPPHKHCMLPTWLASRQCGKDMHALGVGYQRVLVDYKCKTITSTKRTRSVKDGTKLWISSFRAYSTLTCHLFQCTVWSAQFITLHSTHHVL